MNNENIPIPLTKHKYPLIILIFLFSAIIAYIITIVHFTYFETPKHFLFMRRKNHAESVFINGRYEAAIQEFEELQAQYPGYSSRAKIRIGQAYLALSSDNFENFTKGMTYLEGSHLHATIEDIQKFVPEKYKEIFKTLIVSNK